MSERASPLTLALERLTVFDVWKLLDLPGTPKPSCRSPFRDDHNPSFSIYDGRRHWLDHGTGEGGDAADFCAKVRRLSPEDGARLLIELAGTGRKDKDKHNVSSDNKTHTQAPRQKYDPFKDPQKAAKRQNWPSFEIPARAEIEAIALLRSLSMEGVAEAVQRGLLYCADHEGGRAWIVTDSRRINAQARRLDGQLWQKINGKKAWTLPGSIAAWPIGLLEAKAFPAIALVEGSADLLAAYHLAWCLTSTPETLALGKGTDVLGNLGVVAIFGARTHIVDAALPLFADKRVRIFAHDDASGYGGAALWTSQLKAAGAAAVDTFGFAGFRQSNGRNVNDLNDFVRLDYDQWEAERELVESIFDFVPATQRLQPNTYA